MFPSESTQDLHKKSSKIPTLKASAGRSCNRTLGKRSVIGLPLRTVCSLAASQSILISNIPCRPTCALPQGKEHDLNLTSVGLIQRKAFPPIIPRTTHIADVTMGVGVMAALFEPKTLVDMIEAPKLLNWMTRQSAPA